MSEWIYEDRYPIPEEIIVTPEIYKLIKESWDREYQQNISLLTQHDIYEGMVS